MIRIVCESCGTRLKGPDEAAGRSIPCPRCGKPIPVPVPGIAEDRPPDDVYGTDEPPPPRAPARPAAAADENRFAPPKAEIKKPKKPKSRKSASRDDDELSGLDTVICILCPGIACIASIVYMLQGKGKALKVFLLSIVGHVFWFLFRLGLRYMADPSGGP